MEIPRGVDGAALEDGGENADNPDGDDQESQTVHAPADGFRREDPMEGGDDAELDESEGGGVQGLTDPEGLDDFFDGGDEGCEGEVIDVCAEAVCGRYNTSV